MYFSVTLHGYQEFHILHFSCFYFCLQCEQYFSVSSSLSSWSSSISSSGNFDSRTMLIPQKWSTLSFIQSKSLCSPSTQHGSRWKFYNRTVGENDSFFPVSVVCISLLLPSLPSDVSYSWVLETEIGAVRGRRCLLEFYSFELVPRYS